MEPILNKFDNNTENEDEDYGCYFLQPAPSPYNITEKVQQANLDLLDNNLKTERNPKVKFKEELITYEPNLTDDDVNSIESDSIETQIVDTNQSSLEYKSCNVINLNIFDINEVEDEDEDEDKAVVEEITESEDNDDDDDGDSIGIVEETIEMSPLTMNLSPKLPSNQQQNKPVVSCRKKPKLKQLNCDTIDCKHHCIERLDFNLSMSIKKLQIHEKPTNCPLLRLQQRKCCDEIKMRNPQTKLPYYNGYRSEYGLSSTELEKREKRKQIIELKIQKRKQLLEEYKNRKNQQNEAVFCQWLKDVSKRKQLQRQQQQQQIENKLTNSSKKQLLSPNIINFPTKVNENLIGRPKTANEFRPKHQVKKWRQRPHTSSTCVFIEVSPKLLEKGIQIGDVLISNRAIERKQLHVMTITS